MGKNRIIKSLGKNIGNLVVHKILEKYSNNLEALNHLKHEVIAYGENMAKIAEEFNWNQEDLEEIRLEALNKIEKEMKQYYEDVKFPIDEPEELINEILKEIIQE